MCSTSPNAILREPRRKPPPALQQQLRYYSSAVHAAAFVLPTFAERAVAPVRRPQLPHACCSRARPLLSGGNLALTAVGVVLGAAAAAAFGLARANARA